MIRWYSIKYQVEIAHCNLKISLLQGQGVVSDYYYKSESTSVRGSKLCKWS